MKKNNLSYLKVGAGVIIVLMLIGALAFAVNKLLFTHKEPVETPKPSKSIEDIVQENSSDLDKAKTDKFKVTSATDIYSIIHEMSNTLIIPEDGLIFGEVPITEEKINDVMSLINKTDLVDKSEKEVLLNILNRWKHKDYSQAVSEHNYVWNKLNGNVGRAKELRSEYRK